MTGARSARLPHHLSVVLRGVQADNVLLDLDLAGIAASTGSACATLTQMPSPTLRAIGCALDGPLCFTFGRFSTAGDVEAVLRQLPRIVAQRRALAPVGRR